MKKLIIGKKLITGFFCLLIYTQLLGALPEHIVIREATHEDLPQIYACDKTVTYEYFLQAYKTGYAHLPIGQDPEYYLAIELADDVQWLPKCIECEEIKLLIAYDTERDTVAGFAVAEPIATDAVEIDLLFIQSRYRRLGIGKALIGEVIKLFPMAQACELYTLKFANDKALAFYQAQGFVNCGAPAADRIGPHGIPYSELYYHLIYKL